MVVLATTRGMARIGVRGLRTAWESWLVELCGLDRDRRIMNVGSNIVDVNGELSEKPCIHNENYTKY